MAAYNPTFAPGNTTSTVSVSTTSASASVSQNANTVRLYNAGTTTCFVRFGRTSATATTSDMPLPGGAIESFTKGSNDVVAAITASGTTTLYVTAGEGF